MYYGGTVIPSQLTCCCEIPGSYPIGAGSLLGEGDSAIYTDKVRVRVRTLTLMKYTMT
jgi:hypothetical protein